MPLAGLAESRKRGCKPHDNGFRIRFPYGVWKFPQGSKGSSKASEGSQKVSESFRWVSQNSSKVSESFPSCLWKFPKDSKGFPEVSAGFLKGFKNVSQEFYKVRSITIKLKIKCKWGTFLNSYHNTKRILMMGTISWLLCPNYLRS